MGNPLAADLDLILQRTDPGVWEDLRGQRIFITGGTGFFGCWLLESLAWANERMALGASAVVLTRDPEAFRRKAPHLASHAAFTLHRGDVRDFEFPTGNFSHAIHAATDTVPSPSESMLATLDTIIEGTRRTLEFAAAHGVRKVLLASSGKVYGPQPSDVTHVPETFGGAPDPADPASDYGEAKRVAELLGSLYHRRHGIESKIARCFAFVGPYMRFDAHFAIGNFLRDRARGGPIRVSGDGTPHRSFLYAADLTIWLWTILTRGAPCRAYNVGSERSLSIREAADLVARGARPACAVEVAQTARAGMPPSRYVPATARARGELGLAEYTSLETAIQRTASWRERAIGVQSIIRKASYATI